MSKELKMPEYPKRDDFYSDKQYLDAIKQYKSDRQKWLNQNKDRSPRDKEYKEIMSKRRISRMRKDKRFRRKQLDQTVQKRITAFKKEDKYHENI